MFRVNGPVNLKRLVQVCDIDDRPDLLFDPFTPGLPDELKSGWDRDRIMAEINELGVPCYSGGCAEVYLEKAFDGTGFRPAKRLPVAKELGETSLVFLCHPTLTDDNVAKTCEVLESVMSRAV